MPRVSLQPQLRTIRLDLWFLYLQNHVGLKHGYAMSEKAMFQRSNDKSTPLLAHCKDLHLSETTTDFIEDEL